MTLPAEHNELYLIGIGAAAGGLEALQALLPALPEPLPHAALILVQTLGPHPKTRLVPILSSHTRWSVQEARQAMRLEPGCLYVVPQGHEARVSQGQFELVPLSPGVAHQGVTDRLFESLARARGSQAVGVLLSGSGSEGVQGLRAIFEAGGLTLVQEPSTARQPEMPQAALDQGVASLSLTPAQLGARLNNLLTPPDLNLLPPLESIFRLLSQHTGTDFLNYKPSTLYRRLDKRLKALHLDNPADYLSHLETHPEELPLLAQSMIVSVTSFFRDRPAFERLEVCLRELIQAKSPAEPLRVWVPACASGEEAYSLAMLLVSLLEEYGRSDQPLQIFASDIDEAAIGRARTGLFPRAAVEDLPESLRTRFCTPLGEYVEITKQLRSRMLFTRHDITTHPPFLKLDLISCRNLLIYLGPVLQKHLLPVFHYALNAQGYLFLGKSESINEFGTLFATVDEKCKIFQRKQGSSRRAVRLASFRPHQPVLPSLPVAPVQALKQDHSIGHAVKETLFASFEHPYVVINDNLDVQEISGDVRLYLGLGHGQVNTHILKLIQADLQLELMSVISRALHEQSTVKSNIRAFAFLDQTHYVRLIVKPLLFTEKPPDLYLVVFEKIHPEEYRLPAFQSPHETGDSARVLELEHELGTLKAQLQDYIEELESSNEELQSLNEELHSTNEELQASNEELETSNEELQSAYEEMQVGYTELQATHRILAEKEVHLRGAESNTRALLQNSLQAFLLIDEQFCLQACNQQAILVLNRLTGKTLERGESVLNYLPETRRSGFQEALEQALQGQELSGRCCLPSFDGSDCWLAYTFTPIVDRERRAVSLGLLDVSSEIASETALRHSESTLRTLIENTSTGYILLDAQQQISAINPMAQRWLKQEFGLHAQVGDAYLQLLPAYRHALLQTLFERALQGERVNYELSYLQPDGVLNWYAIAYHPVRDAAESLGVCIAIVDITEHKLLVQQLRENTAHLVACQEIAEVGSWELDLTQRELPDALVLRGSAECLRILGLDTQSEVSVAQFLSRVPPEDHPLVRDTLEQALRNHAVYSLEHRFIRGDGLERVIYSRAEILADSVTGQRLKLIGTCQDITERKQAELERNQIILDLLTRKQALEQFAYIVSHNLRAPVANIMGLAQILISDAERVPSQTPYLQGLERSAARLDEIICDLNTILQIRQGLHEKKTWVSCSELLEDLALSLEDLLKQENAVLQTDFSAQDSILTLKSYLYSVLHNLITNSLKFRSPKRDPIIEITSRVEQQRLILSVKDNGRGMDLERLGEQVFGLYKRFHPEVEGRGLGLFMVKSQVESLGGQIGLTSTPGEGTTFTLSFEA
ncbi:MAG: CheR family methyltransferase [Candidatus Sericytochromatia bacterium]